MSGRATALAVWLAGAVLLTAAGCRQDPATPRAAAPAPPLTLLALGDSYTVGHAVPAAYSWPRQLADSLAVRGDTLQARVLAATGWTTGHLLAAVRQEQAAGGLDQPFGLVTVMIGVNDQFQGVDPALFRARLDTLAGVARELAHPHGGAVLGFTIPDYGVTPVGGMFDCELIAAQIAAFNDTLAMVFGAAGIPVVDVAALSSAAAREPSLVARDGLHFSGEMYRRWVAAMLPEVRRCLHLEP